jgi:hypothetical protein
LGTYYSSLRVTSLVNLSIEKMGFFGSEAGFI